MALRKRKRFAAASSRWTRRNTVRARRTVSFRVAFECGFAAALTARARRTSTARKQAALEDAVKALTPSSKDGLKVKLPEVRMLELLKLTLPPHEGEPFDLLDLVGHYVLTLVPGTGWAPTVLLPDTEEMLAQLRDGEAARAGVHEFTTTHSGLNANGEERSTHTCPHCPAHAGPRPRMMEEAEAAAAAAAAAATAAARAGKTRGKAQMHESIKGARARASVSAAPRRAARAVVRSLCARHIRSWPLTPRRNGSVRRHVHRPLHRHAHHGGRHRARPRLRPRGPQHAHHGAPRGVVVPRVHP
jgi:hypothetical protein